ncbi:alkaline phosphatase family protein [Paenibacillus alkalitolerans]|uniref:alkaline phosphatase family protein n=1 Tax=Paenibacillus alkalitolerans TaxID=2799335 RepID=UPI002D7F0A05|nr:alkaline phosphatase family protein [Paenibacillus alkalitolerans]
MNFTMRKMAQTLIFFIMIALVSGCLGRGTEHNGDLLEAKSKRGNASKKVILIVADSLMYQAVDQGLKQNILPTFKYLIDNGIYHKDVVSSFPTMSVTIDSSMLTGTYPDKHRVPGLIWYSSDEKRLVNYGTGFMEEIRQGLNTVLTDAFINLNGKHLNPSTETIHETLAKHGLTSGSINGLIFRGSTEHTLTIPPWMHTTTALPKHLNVNGPALLSLGVFANPLEGIRQLPDGMTAKLGLNSDYSFEVASHLIETGQLPDFLFMYLPDLDKRLHRRGPGDLGGPAKLDEQLNSFLQSFGSIDKALQEAVIIIAGDSGMSQLRPTGRQPVIELHKLLGDDGILRPGASADENTKIVLAVNETMAYVYQLDPKRSLRQLSAQLMKEPRIDLAAWKEGDWIHVVRNGVSGAFRYKKNGPVPDIYGQRWTLDGNPDVADVEFDDRNRLKYGDYPDALQRLFGALNSHEGRFLAVTPKEGYEFADRSSPKHRGGGGHGSLHRTESLVPIIICGTNQDLEHHRIVDIKNYIEKLLIK